MTRQHILDNYRYIPSPENAEYRFEFAVVSASAINGVVWQFR